MTLNDFYHLVGSMPPRMSTQEWAYWCDDQYGGNHLAAWRQKARANRAARKLDKMAEGFFLKEKR